MDTFRRKVRDWLYNCTKGEFYKALGEAKINPRQLAVCEKRFIDGLFNYQVGMELNISDKTVERDVTKVYDALHKILQSEIAKSPWSVRFSRTLQGLFCVLGLNDSLMSII